LASYPATAYAFNKCVGVLERKRPLFQIHTAVDFGGNVNILIIGFIDVRKIILGVREMIRQLVVSSWK